MPSSGIEDSGLNSAAGYSCVVCLQETRGTDRVTRVDRRACRVKAAELLDSRGYPLMLLVLCRGSRCDSFGLPFSGACCDPCFASSSSRSTLS